MRPARNQTLMQIYSSQIPCLTICGAMTFVFLACGSTGGIIGFAIVFGFFSGAYVSLLPSIQAGFARNVQEIGVRLGLPFTLLSIGALVGTPISGKSFASGLPCPERLGS